MTPQQWRRSADAAERRAASKDSPATANQRPTRRRLSILASMAADAHHERTRAKIYRGIAAAIDAGHAGPIPASPKDIQAHRDSPHLKWADYGAGQPTETPSEPVHVIPSTAELWNAAQSGYAGYFPTPADAANIAARCLDLGPDVSEVWEPSCGSGDLIAAIDRVYAGPPYWTGRVRGDEIVPTLAALARRRIGAASNIRSEVHTGDMYSHDGKYAAVLMNPPFEHCEDSAAVYRVLMHNTLPGARVVAIMSPAWQHSDRVPHANLRSFLANRAASFQWCPDWEALGLNRARAFQTSLRSTGVNTGLLIVDLPR